MKFCVRNERTTNVGFYVAAVARRRICHALASAATIVIVRSLSLLLIVFCAVGVRAASPITAIAIAPDGTQVVIGSQNGIEIRSLPDLTVVSKLSTELENVHDLKFSPDGRSLLAAGGSPAESGRVETWSWPDRKRVGSVGEHDDVVYRVAWSLDGTQWVTCSGDGRCIVFSSATGKPLTKYEGHSRAVLAVCYLGDRTIVSAGVDQTVRLWSSANGSHVRTLDNHVATANDIAVRPSFAEPLEVIATISEDRTVRLWQPLIGRLMRFVRLSSVPRSVAWSSDGSKLYVGCNDGHLRTIDADNMEVSEEMKDSLSGRIYQLALLPPLDQILIAGNGVQILAIQKK